jgi:hypothetical protein
MPGQFQFAMHKNDEREFASELLLDPAIRLINGPRWPQQNPKTWRRLEDIHDSYCIIWSAEDAPHLSSEYIPTCNDWYCRSEYATIQFLRSSMRNGVLTTGRIACGYFPDDFPEESAKSLTARFNQLRRLLKKTYRNSVVRWENPSLPYSDPIPGRSGNPLPPDSSLWIGPHAMEWLKKSNKRRIKLYASSYVEARLVPGLGGN